MLVPGLNYAFKNTLNIKLTFFAVGANACARVELCF